MAPRFERFGVAFIIIVSFRMVLGSFEENVIRKYFLGSKYSQLVEFRIFSGHIEATKELTKNFSWA